MKHITVILVLSILFALPNLAGGQKIVPNVAVMRSEMRTRALQKELKAQGYYNGPIDGIYGKETENAIPRRKMHRESIGEEAGARPDSALIEQSRPGGCPEGPPCPPKGNPPPRPPKRDRQS